MEIITPKQLAQNVAARWLEQYQEESLGNTHKAKIYRRLVDESPTTPEEVAAIIGNTSWILTTCNECGAENVPVVRLGEPLDYESSTADICLDCINKAWLMIRDAD